MQGVLDGRKRNRIEHTIMIEVKFTGKVVSNNTETKAGNNGEYTKTEVVLQAPTDNGYTDTLALVCFGENALKVKDIAIGTTLHVRGGASSREWNDRYYTQVSLLNWEVKEEVKEEQSTAQAEQPKPEPKSKEKPQGFAPQQQKDDLPF